MRDDGLSLPVAVIVVQSVLPVGVVAGIVGVPLGLAMQRVVLDYMGAAASHTAIPASVVDVLSPPILVALALAGLAIAALGAWIPGLRAARSRIAPVLQGE